jgi:hypothetical protein
MTRFIKLENFNYDTFWHPLVLFQNVCLMVFDATFLFVCLMVLYVTFNNISVISWQSVLLVEETGGPWQNHNLSQVTDKLYQIMLHTSPWSRFKLTTSVVIDTDCIGSCKSNYHTITATKTPCFRTILKAMDIHLYLKCFDSSVIHSNIGDRSNISNIHLVLFLFAVDVAKIELFPFSHWQSIQIFFKVHKTGWTQRNVVSLRFTASEMVT